MKKVIGILSGIMMMWLTTQAFAQKWDEARMQRDIEVAENVLETLLRQQFDRQKMFFPMEVKGNYQPGYGITFRLPADFTTPIVFSFDGLNHNDFMWNNPPAPGMYSYSNTDINDAVHDAVNEALEREQERIEAEQERIENERERIEAEQERIQEEQEQIQEEQQRIKQDRKHVVQKKNKDDHVQRIEIETDPDVVVIKEKGRKDVIRHRSVAAMDSIRNLNNGKMIAAAKDFLADYGDLIGQLKPEERIIITNQGEQPRMWVGKLVDAPNRTHLSIEVMRGDIAQYKQGKISRDQLLSKIKVVNTETVDVVEPDLELLSSIFNRLYRPDLAPTYFTEDRIYYERLKDFGVIYYMQVYSSNQDGYTFSMPTVKLRDLDQKTRDAKVKELYPAFEKEIKENMLEYGRTVKSLKDNEVLTFNIKLTKCVGCGIPSTLEVSVKGDVLKDYGSGKMDKAVAMNKITMKRGAEQ